MTPRQYSILVGAIVTAVLSTSYLGFINAICCLGVIIGGVVAAQQYVTRSGAHDTGPILDAGDGAVLGALSGVGGAVLAAFLDLLLRPVGLDSQSIGEGMMQDMMQGTQGIQGQEGMMQGVQGGGAMMFIVWLVLTIVVYAIFGAIGGAIGAAIFGQDAPQDTGSPEPGTDMG